MNIELRKQTRLLTANKVCREDINIIPVLQQKTVTEPGAIVPDAGYVGLSKVIVSTPASAGSGVIESLGNPLLPKFGRLKYFESAGSSVRYKDVYPTYVSGVRESGIYSGHKAGFGADWNEVLSAVYVENTELVRSPLSAEQRIVATGGKFYDGYYFCNSLSAVWEKNFYNGTAVIKDIYIPQCICRAALYNANTDSIETVECTLGGDGIENVSSAAGDGKYSVAVSYLDIVCNIHSLPFLGAEFLYSKYDILFSGAADSLAYSCDNGVSFYPITDGLMLKQIEHVMIRNEGSGACKVGSTAGASDYAVIPAGATSAVEAKAAGTWYIS